jgi:hypothetical protein
MRDTNEDELLAFSIRRTIGVFRHGSERCMRQILHRQARELVYKVFSYFRREAEAIRIYVQGKHKITLHIQNDTENKCGVLRNSHLHQSIEKHSKFCFK